MTDIVLVYPANLAGHASHYIQPPLGLAAIGAYAERHGFGVKVIDLEIQPPDFDLERVLTAERPRIVGIGGTTHTRLPAFDIARIAKRMPAPPWTVYGGPHATFTAEDTLAHIPDIDFIVRDEGEITFLELARCLSEGPASFKSIAGLSWRDGGAIRHNPPRPRIKNLDEVPHGRHLLEMERYTLVMDFLKVPGVSIVTSRGCPYKCTYCSASAMFGTAYTMRSAGHVADEIEYCIARLGVRAVKIHDNALTISKTHVRRLVEELRRRKIELPWECEIKANTVNEDLLRTMKAGGCYYVDIGAESGSEELLRTVHKGNTVQEVVDVLNWCRDLGIKTKLFFSIGHAGETLDQARDTIRFIDRYRNRISRIAKIIGIMVYPGTGVERYAFGHNLLGEGFSWSKPLSQLDQGLVFSNTVPLLFQPQFGRDEMKKCRVLLYRSEIKHLLMSPRAVREKWREVGGFKELAKVVGYVVKNIVGRFRPPRNP